MLDFSLPHRRLNPLINEWILVSPHRAKRPWQGTMEASQQQHLPEYEPTCHLCPGNKRTSEETNPHYKNTFVFTNDHSALLPDVTAGEYTASNNLLVAQQVKGLSRVICYTPSHNLTMAEMTPSQIGEVINTWTHEYETIGALDYISYVQIFENKGPLMGASSPHPHGQIWASGHLPTHITKELAAQLSYRKNHKNPLLVDYLHAEQNETTRIIYQNKDFTILVPFWATWPYETMILPKTPKRSLSDFSDAEKKWLADALKNLTSRYDRLFNTPFPYSMGIHQAPTDNTPHKEWQLHFHFYPPLLRSATVKKYFVGYEMLAEAQRDISPEIAAKTLRDLS